MGDPYKSSCKRIAKNLFSHHLFTLKLFQTSMAFLKLFTESRFDARDHTCQILIRIMDEFVWNFFQ